MPFSSNFPFNVRSRRDRHQKAGSSIKERGEGRRGREEETEGLSHLKRRNFQNFLSSGSNRNRFMMGPIKLSHVCSLI